MSTELDFNFFSPELPLNLALAEEKGVKVVVKRDDLIHPFISGNKWRKLKHTLFKAREENKSHLITFGGNWSNHILAVACAAATFRFKCTAYIRGEQVDNPLLSLCRLYGMELHFVARTEYRDKRKIFNTCHAEQPETFFIDEGGYSAEGALGCQDIVKELKGRYDHIFVACGTGTTLAGISQSAATHQKDAKIHGVPVLKGGDFIREAVHSIYPSAEICLHNDYHFGGYAKSTSVLIDFIKTFVSDTGLLIEPVYTGKLFYALNDLLSKDYFKRGDSILMIHSGGLTGFLGQAEKFN